MLQSALPRVKLEATDRAQANSAFHPSGVGKWGPASAEKDKAVVHSVSRWTWDVQVKLWDPLRTRAIPECLWGVFTTKYTTIRIHVYLYLTLPLCCVVLGGRWLRVARRMSHLDSLTDKLSSVTFQWAFKQYIPFVRTWWKSVRRRGRWWESKAVVTTRVWLWLLCDLFPESGLHVHPYDCIYLYR